MTSHLAHRGALLAFALFALPALTGCFLFHRTAEGDPPPLPTDAGPLDGDARTGPFTRSCLAQDVRIIECDACAVQSAYWNGSYCELGSSCDCIGEDCDARFDSIRECNDAMAPCLDELCASTGGTPEIGCGHSLCGERNEDPCLVAAPVCRCPADSNFLPTYGCVRDPVCGAAPVEPRALCEASGGAWGPTCCPSRCGEPCGDDCVDNACTCGRFEVFSERVGCIRVDACASNGDPCDRTEDCPLSMTCSEGVCSTLACAE